MKDCDTIQYGYPIKLDNSLLLLQIKRLIWKLLQILGNSYNLEGRSIVDCVLRRKPIPKIMLCTRWKIYGMLHHIFVSHGRWLHGIGQCRMETLTAEGLKINYCASANWEEHVAGQQFKWRIFVLGQWVISHPGTIRSFKIKFGICTESDCTCHSIIITSWVSHFIFKTKILLAIFIVKLFCPLSFPKR